MSRQMNAASKASARQVEKRRRAKKKRDRRGRRGGGGGGGGGGQYSIIEISVGGKTYKFYTPYGVPNAEGSFEPYELWIPDGVTVRCLLLGGAQFHPTHSMRRVVDAEALHSSHRKKAREPWKLTWLCTDDEDAGPSPEGYEPSPKWMESEEDGKRTWVLSASELVYVEITEVKDGYIIEPPYVYAHDLSAYDGVVYPDLYEAQFHAERCLARTESCGFCAQAELEYQENADKDEQTVWAAQDQMFIPLFCLDWLKGEPSEDSRKPTGKFRFPEERDWKPSRDGSEFGIRRGYTFIVTPYTGKGSRALTAAKFDEYDASLFGICCNCLDEHGARKPSFKQGGARVIPHKIFVTEVTCSVTGERLRGEIDAAEAWDLHMNWFEQCDNLTLTEILRGAPMPEKAEDGEKTYYDLLDEWAENPDIEVDEEEEVVYTRPILHLECSTCEQPTPLLRHQVITELTKDPGGYVVPSLFAARNGQIFHKDFSEIPGIYPEGPSVEELTGGGAQAAREGKFEEFWPITAKNTPALVRYSAQDALRVVGSDLFDYGQKYGERRARRAAERNDETSSKHDEVEY